jgi:hypothetical protein
MSSYRCHTAAAGVYSRLVQVLRNIDKVVYVAGQVFHLPVGMISFPDEVMGSAARLWAWRSRFCAAQNLD